MGRYKMKRVEEKIIEVYENSIYNTQSRTASDIVTCYCPAEFGLGFEFDCFDSDNKMDNCYNCWFMSIRKEMRGD
jgi:hypothetical protein